MKTIPLTRGKVALVDDEDFDRLSRFTWHYAAVGYAARRERVKTKGVPGKIVYMHREVLCLTGNAQVDHINMDKLDNRRKNLRPATKSQNQGNISSKHSGYKGVGINSGRPKPKPWRAYIMVNRKYIHLGSFASPEEAARAYNEVALKHFGAFARLNEFPT